MNYIPIRLFLIRSLKIGLAELSSYFRATISGVVLTTFVSTIYVLAGDFNGLLEYFSFAAWVFYFITVLGLIVLRFKMPDEHREFKVPIVIPVVFCLCALYLIVAPLIAEFSFKYIGAVVFILFGLVYYIPFVYFGITIPCLHGFFKKVQYACNIAVSAYHEEGESNGEIKKNTDKVELEETRDEKEV